MSKPVTGFSYMTAFECLADRCEDSCCVGLKVPVDEADAQRLVQLGLEVDRTGEQPVLPRTREGRCAMLDAGGLCSVHRLHGPAALPRPCAVFPRVTIDEGTQVFVLGSLGCPEVARLLLTKEDAVLPAAMSPDILPRPVEGGEAAPEDAVALLKLGGELLLDGAFPLRTRLLLLLELCGAAERARVGGAERLDQVLARLQRPDARAAVHTSVRALAPLPSGALSLCASILRASRAPPLPPEVHAWFSALVDGREDQPSLELAWATARRHSARHAQALEQHAVRVAANQWRREGSRALTAPLAACTRTTLTTSLYLFAATLFASDVQARDGALVEASVRSAYRLGRYVLAGSAYAEAINQLVEGPASSVAGRLLALVALCDAPARG